MALKYELKTQGDFLFRHRSYLPVVIIVVGMAVYVWQWMNGNVAVENRPLYEIIYFLICLLGLGIRMLAVGHAAAETSGRNTTEGQIASTVNTTGLYSLCRHPLYVGNFFMWLGIACFTQHFWFVAAFVFMYWVYYERIMYAEEEFLIGQYGEQYTNWSATTPAFIPKLTGWKKPLYSFSWKKIIKQEKAGILNMFLVVFVFEAIGEHFFMEGSMEKYWLYGFIGSIVWYVVIKLIQKTTKLLESDR